MLSDKINSLFKYNPVIKIEIEKKIIVGIIKYRLYFNSLFLISFLKITIRIGIIRYALLRLWISNSELKNKIPFIKLIFLSTSTNLKNINTNKKDDIIYPLNRNE